MSSNMKAGRKLWYLENQISFCEIIETTLPNDIQKIQVSYNRNLIRLQYTQNKMLSHNIVERLTERQIIIFIKHN